jgi:hypothetical protein
MGVERSDTPTPSESPERIDVSSVKGIEPAHRQVEDDATGEQPERIDVSSVKGIEPAHRQVEDDATGEQLDRPDGSSDAPVEWRSFHELREGVEDADVTTEPDQAVFYRGRDPVLGDEALGDQAEAVANRRIAESFAEQTGRTTLEQTPGGQWLETATGSAENPNPNLTDSERRELWDRLSERYAEGASGEVHVFARKPNPATPEGDTWDRVEERALKGNPSVTVINRY